MSVKKDVQLIGPRFADRAYISQTDLEQTNNKI